MTFEEAEAAAREECRKTCRALMCQRGGRCIALLYDTPGFWDRIEARLDPDDHRILNSK